MGWGGAEEVGWVECERTWLCTTSQGQEVEDPRGCVQRPHGPLGVMEARSQFQAQQDEGFPVLWKLVLGEKWKHGGLIMARAGV